MASINRDAQSRSTQRRRCRTVSAFLAFGMMRGATVPGLGGAMRLSANTVLNAERLFTPVAFQKAAMSTRCAAGLAGSTPGLAKPQERASWFTCSSVITPTTDAPRPDWSKLSACAMLRDSRRSKPKPRGGQRTLVRAPAQGNRRGTQEQR